MRVLPPPHTGFNDRMAALVTILLALFAFLSYARTTLPDLPVSTWMDTMIFQSIFMTFTGLVDNVFAYETVVWARNKGQNRLKEDPDLTIYEYDNADLLSFEHTPRPKSFRLSERRGIIRVVAPRLSTDTDRAARAPGI